MELTDRPVQNVEIAMQVIEGNAYLMDAAASELHALSPVGTRIYELIDGVRTVDAIVVCLCDEYDAGRDVIERDTLSFLEEIESKGLVLRS